MKFTGQIAAGLLALFVGAYSQAAHATVYTFNLTYSDTPAFTNNTVLSGNPGRFRSFNDGPSDFSVTGFQSGDSISVNVTVGGAGLHLQDTGNPFLNNLEFIGVNGFVMNGWNQSTDNPNNHVVQSVVGRTTLTITGYNGDLTSTIFDTGVVSGSANSPSVNANFSGNITNSEVWLTSFNITRSLTSIQFINEFSNLSLPLNLTSNGVLLAFDDIASVPTPGSFALLGFGLIGAGAARRMRKAA